MLVFVYLANLAFTLVTHRDVFAFEEEEEADDESTGEHRRKPWSMPVSVGVLAAATAVTALEAQFIAGALEAAASSLRLSPFFLGVVVLAVVGNAAEYVSAAYFARRDRMGLAFSIAVGSTIQIGWFEGVLLLSVYARLGLSFYFV